MEILKGALFGIVQGLTEFLPVSSSGHLAIFNKLFGYAPEENFLFPVIAVHAATLLAVVVVFRRDVINMFTDNRRMILLIITGSVPAGIFGLAARNLVEYVSCRMLIVGLGFITTSLFLLFGSKFKDKSRNLKNLPFGSAFAIGLAQALAILPGVSRSGSTIAMAQSLGVENDSAARFSFLLMIPAVGGAAILDLKDVMNGCVSVNWTLVAVSFFSALVVGIVSLKLLLKLLARGRLYYFSYYLVPLGILSILYGLLV